jgi:dihydrofolate reductase
MSGKIILNLAMSIDGFIAKEDDTYAWIKGCNNAAFDTDRKYDYPAFLRGVDIVVMGRRCYELGMHADFADKTVYVATTQPIPNHDNVVFIDTITDTLKRERANGKTIYLFGGGVLVDAFIKGEYIVGIIPTILGAGIPLFLDRNPEIPLSLTGYFVEDGMVVLQYVRREDSEN